MVSGSLDVLETVGKKTFDVSDSVIIVYQLFVEIDLFFIKNQVINEADPELKGARRLLTQRKQPTLSEVSLLSFNSYTR